jgi:hypothetical protein
MSRAVVTNWFRRSFRLGLAAAMLCSSAAPALAASTGIEIGLTVPQACFVQTPAGITVNDGGLTSGTAWEACNSGGYIVTANYRELGQGEGAVLIYNGMAIDLPASGQVVVRVSDIATIKQIGYQLQSSHLDTPLQVSLNVQPT